MLIYHVTSTSTELGGDFSVTDEIPKETKEYAYDDDSDIEDVDDMESFQSISADGGGILASPKNLADAGIAAKVRVIFRFVVYIININYFRPKRRLLTTVQALLPC